MPDNEGFAFRTIFPERQIYIRSAGRVQFWTFGSAIQAVLAAMALLLIGCTAFASVVVIFKDRSLTARDERYERTRAAYESRISRLQAAYGDLRGELARSQRQFDASVRGVKKKQDMIAGLYLDEDAIESGFANASAAPPAEARSSPSYVVGPFRDDGTSPAPQDPQARPANTGVWPDLLSRLLANAAPLFSRRDEPAGTPVANPALIALGRQTHRVQLLDASENTLLENTGQMFSRRISELQNVIRHAGVDPGDLMRTSQHGVGGPEIPLDRIRIVGIADPGFTHAWLRASAVLDQIGLVSGVMRHMPLTLPVSAVQFDRTSGFGPRRDPFTGRYAFHPGLDFGGPWGAPVTATAPGVVVFAGNRGSYGMTVEIDHGMGFHTRYAHLSAITVRTGMAVARGTVIGKVGSTGRSTGPHVHYEVWYNNVVRNPATFIAAGGGFSQPVDRAFDAKLLGGEGQD